jgi:hypothetical protein
VRAVSGIQDAVPSYGLDIDVPGEPYRSIASHEFAEELGTGDEFEFDGRTLRVTGVGTNVVNAPGEPEFTLYCILRSST